MVDWLLWFTRMENSKPLALVLFFGAFCGILIYVFTGKQRAKRLESYKYIPFDDDGPPLSDSLRSEQRSQSRKVMDNE
ncbi:MAG TPA: cbb3-type cytochrome c oxidase subunit 3 [Candidatus Competibacter sp.]|nr:CcoQ/FixQ family Cbb3-type cytochrome c oxidase assembly chaperone [Candidatus Competibacteraceae bacterium]HRC71106.1 cbb3-type cytochrome c oxidase subunit 3 [Candidatus Competibacter sp.]